MVLVKDVDCACGCCVVLMLGFMDERCPSKMLIRGHFQWLRFSLQPSLYPFPHSYELLEGGGLAGIGRRGGCPGGGLGVPGKRPGRGRSPPGGRPGGGTGRPRHPTSLGEAVGPQGAVGLPRGGNLADRPSPGGCAMAGGIRLGASQPGQNSSDTSSKLL